MKRLPRKTGLSQWVGRLLVLCCLGAAPLVAAPPARMVWMTVDLPPASLPVNGKMTDGITDTVFNLVMAEMPELEHRIQVMPAPRVWATLAEGLPMCYLSGLVTPDHLRTAYMVPILLTPPLHVVVRADAADRLPRNAKGEVLPQALFQHADLRGLVTPRRSYSLELDTMLANRGPDSGVREAIATSSGSNILQMLNLGRADYTLEFDYAVAYQLSQHPELQQNTRLITLPLAGTQPIPIGMACPHTEWGRAMAMRLDAIVAKVSQRADYQAAVNRWLTPETRARFQKQQAEFFRQRAHMTDPADFPVWPTAK